MVFLRVLSLIGRGRQTRLGSPEERGSDDLFQSGTMGEQHPRKGHYRRLRTYSIRTTSSETRFRWVPLLLSALYSAPAKPPYWK